MYGSHVYVDATQNVTFELKAFESWMEEKKNIFATQMKLKSICPKNLVEAYPQSNYEGVIPRKAGHSLSYRVLKYIYRDKDILAPK